jgi:hypothetical protein
MSIIIDEEAALDALRQTVAKYGEGRTVQLCTYSRPEDKADWDAYTEREALEDDPYTAGAPSCIVGAALHDVLGVPLGVLQELDTTAGGVYHPYGSDTIDSLKTLKVLSAHGFELTGPAVDVLKVAQSVQDNGKEWGYALEKAESWVEQNEAGEVA